MENTSALLFPSSKEPWALLALSLSSHVELSLADVRAPELHPGRAARRTEQSGWCEIPGYSEGAAGAPSRETTAMDHTCGATELPRPPVDTAEGHRHGWWPMAVMG